MLFILQVRSNNFDKIIKNENAQVDVLLELFEETLSVVNPENVNLTLDESVLNNFDGMTGERILYDTNSLKERIDAALSNNRNVGMTIWTPKYTDHITLHGMADGIGDVSTKGWNEGSGHAIFVTGTNDQGIVVSSWGRQYYISWQDLEFSQFSIASSTIK